MTSVIKSLSLIFLGIFCSALPKPIHADQNEFSLNILTDCLAVGETALGCVGTTVTSCISQMEKQDDGIAVVTDDPVFIGACAFAEKEAWHRLLSEEMSNLEKTVDERSRISGDNAIRISFNRFQAEVVLSGESYCSLLSKLHGLSVKDAYFSFESNLCYARHMAATIDIINASQATE